MSHHHFHHHHHSHPVRGDYTYSEEPVTLLQKRTWKTKGIIWMIPTGLIVVGSIALVIIFSVIESNMESGLPFLVMPVFAGVPLAFGLPYMEQGFTKRPQVTQIYDYGSYKREKVVKVKVKCPKCEAENQFGSTNCKECGEELPQCCPHCGAELIPNDEACRDCGLALR